MKTLDLPGIRKVHRGKVREMFGLNGQLLMVATDRISAFDVVLPNTIPKKGKVLTQLSSFWFGQLKEIVDNHLISDQVRDFPISLQSFREQLAGRSMLVRKCRPLPIECVVRGYLAGSGWKEYCQSGTICEIQLPRGLRQSEELPQPIFTPATKATSGHDENISFERATEILGADLAKQVRDLSLQIYNRAREYALQRGIIVGDTKFEFGLEGSRLLLIDEALTPDSSRFWPADRYEPGKSQASFDKQFIRDFLQTLDWDKTPPAPQLPDSIVEATSRRYLEAYHRLTGKDLDEGS
ncbi:phosphoribosylaminoimidazolesuccinocarboxamide synthase [Acidobacteria bacterium AH-259-O06]|nr:phosphoribosylaminoimidazolesuccinocarboxamide synthase [Acidobacteria bacterium AH-259-O06]